MCGKMALTHIRLVLQTRIRNFFYNGVVSFSGFKTYQNKQVYQISLIKKKSAKKTGFCSNFVKFSKGRHFTVEKFYNMKLNDM